MRSPEKAMIKRIQVVGAAIIEQDETNKTIDANNDNNKIIKTKKVLLLQRANRDTGEGLWEFPGGKIEENESSELALLREIKEELSIEIDILSSLGKLTHQYPKAIIDLEIFVAKIKFGEIKLIEHQSKKWVDPQHIILEELLEADKPFVQRLINYLK